VRSAGRGATDAALAKKRAGWTHGYVNRTTGERCGPQPKQLLAHQCPADHLFYGGAAFGGKSEFAIVEAIQTCLEHDGCEVAIFRRKHTELKKSLIPRFRRLVPRFIAKYNQSDHVAAFFNGSLLWFCHYQYEQDVYNYQSAEWLELLVDEASHFTEFQADYLSTRVRTSVFGWKPRVIYTSNPGNVGHGWLKRKFIAPVPKELGGRPAPMPLQVWRPRKLHANDPTPEDRVRTRCFIPARSEDNQAGMKADPDYMASVWALGGDKAKQLALGDWDANDSMIVGAAWRAHKTVDAGDQLLVAQGIPIGTSFDWHVVNNARWRPPDDAKIYGSVDYGFGAPWSAHLHAHYRTGTGSTHTRTFLEFYHPRVRDVDQARALREAISALMLPAGRPPVPVQCNKDLAATLVVPCGMARPEWLVLDPSMWNSRAEMGISQSIAEVYELELGRIGVICMKGAAGRGARVTRPQRWLDVLADGLDGLPQWSVTVACPDLIRTVPEVPWDEEDPEVEDDESENHAYEDTGRFFEARPAPPRIAAVDPFAGLDPISKAHQELLAKRARPKRGRLGKGLGL
jgi:hypothetical protein